MSKNEKISYIFAVVVGSIYMIYQQIKEFNIVKLLCFLIALILFYYVILYIEKRNNKNKWNIYNEKEQ